VFLLGRNKSRTALLCRSKNMAIEQAEFWSRVADKYDRVADLQIGGTTRSMLRERVARVGHLGRVVEFGCGTGFFTEVLARRSDTLLATDISPGMLELAKRHVKAANVTFQAEDCQHTSLPDGTFDAAFVGLVIHFTQPGRTVAEMHRVLRPGGTLIIANVDLQALTGLSRLRSRIRVLYQGVVGYGIKPPTGFGRNAMTEKQLGELLGRSGFRVESSETVKDSSSSANIPVECVRAVKA